MIKNCLVFYIGNYLPGINLYTYIRGPIIIIISFLGLLSNKPASLSLFLYKAFYKAGERRGRFLLYLLGGEKLLIKTPIAH